jgi:arylsulfatase A-like enzyme
MNRLSLILIALAGFAFTASAETARKPNILVIVADDLGYGELTVQGYTREIPTPHVDSIAQNGVRFTSGYVSGPYCSPTRAGLLTGRYQVRFGHEFNPGVESANEPNVGLPVDEKSLADRLKPAGYRSAWIAVHSPMQGSEKYLARFPGITNPKRRNFAAMLSALDDAVGVVLAKLRETRQEENTLVFFVSDNGGPTPKTTSGNGPLSGFKSETWEGGIRVPWLMQWKGRIPAGKVDDHPVIQLDILPTALAVAGVAVAPEWKIDGVNLVPYLTGEKSGPPHEALFWRFGEQIAVRKGDWKLVKGVNESGFIGAERAVATAVGAQLFNVTKDIGETLDLSAQEPARVKELAAEWETWNKSNIPAKWPPGEGFDKKRVTRLVPPVKAPAVK